MKSTSTRSLFRALNWLYALGLVFTLAIVAANTYGEPRSRQATLVFAPVLLTGALFVGQLLVTKHELARVQTARPERANQTWPVILVTYMVFAFIVWLGTGFATSYLP